MSALRAAARERRLATAAETLAGLLGPPMLQAAEEAQAEALRHPAAAPQALVHGQGGAQSGAAARRNRRKRNAATRAEETAQGPGAGGGAPSGSG